jgi:hypothetical protein
MITRSNPWRERIIGDVFYGGGGGGISVPPIAVPPNQATGFSPFGGLQGISDIGQLRTGGEALWALIRESMFPLLFGALSDSATGPLLPQAGPFSFPNQAAIAGPEGLKTGGGQGGGQGGGAPGQGGGQGGFDTIAPPDNTQFLRYIIKRMGFPEGSSPWKTGDFAAYGAPGKIIEAAFDPQHALHDRTLNQLRSQTDTQLAETGLANTPYGAAVMGNALSNFNIDWQNQLLNREITGAEGAAQLYGQAIGAGSGALAPQQSAVGADLNLEGLASTAQTSQNQLAVQAQEAEIQAMLANQQLKNQASQFNAGKAGGGIQSGLSAVSGIGKG